MEDATEETVKKLNSEIAELKHKLEMAEEWEKEYRQCWLEKEGALSRCDELLEELQECKSKIDGHNKECVRLCEVDHYNNCDQVYYGPHNGKRQCPDCPRDWIIE